MNKVFSYGKARILFTYSVAVLALLFIISLSFFALTQEIKHGGVTNNLPLLIIFLAISTFFLLVAAKIIDTSITSIEVGERGVSYKSLFKKRFIPWEDIIEINRVDLVRMPSGLPEYYNPSRPVDLKIKTKSNGQLYILNYLKLKDSNDSGINAFIDELLKHTQWKDTEAQWKSTLRNRRNIGRIIIGCSLIIFGLLFPSIFKESKIHSRILQIIIENIGFSGASLFFIISGLFTLLIKNKRLE